VAETEAVSQVRTVIAEAQLRLPAGIRIRRGRSSWDRRRRLYGIPRQADACPERIMKSLTIVPSIPGSGWQRRMYVAVARPPSGIELGVADAREEASLHLIVGRW
jgi:hypothetical protein